MLADDSIPCYAAYTVSVALEGERGEFREMGVGTIAVRPYKHNFASLLDRAKLNFSEGCIRISLVRTTFSGNPDETQAGDR
jgi:hypothetical protein